MRRERITAESIAFAAEVRRVRGDMTRAAFAQMLGVSQQITLLWEQGRSVPLLGDGMKLVSLGASLTKYAHAARPLSVLFRFAVRDRGYDTPCWEWAGPMDPNGYGRFGSAWAHRSVFEVERGPIPKGMHLDHLCRVTSCVNPAHLEVVTPLVNTLRSSATRLTSDQILEIRTSSETNRQVARRFGVHDSHVSRIRSGFTRANPDEFQEATA